MKRLKDQLLNQSLKTKWMFTAGITIFISFAIISFILYVALQTWLLNNEEKNAIRTVDEVTTFFSKQGPAVTIQEIQNNTSLMKAILNQEQTVRIFNLDGIEIIRINDTSGAAPIPQNYKKLLTGEVVEQTIDGSDAFVVNKIVQIGPVQGIMQLIHPLTTYNSMMNYIITTMCIVGLGALILSVSIGYYLANLLMRPLVQLRDSMQTVRDKGFEEPIRFKYTAEDEIGDLLRIYQSMINELEMAFTQQQQFVADASHELRTPLQVLEGHLSLIKRWGKDDPEILIESLDTSLSQLAQMKTLIEELLSLAKREKNDPNTSVDLTKVLTVVVEELKLVHRDAVFENSVVGQQKEVFISEQALTQILRNIIENGIRYNENLTPRLKTTIHYEPESVFVQIEDNGIGISEEHLPHIFNRFYRVDEARVQKAGGTGLGLSITKMLVEKYNLEMEVTSRLRRGTTFLIRFPLKNEEI